MATGDMQRPCSFCMRQGYCTDFCPVCPFRLGQGVIGYCGLPMNTAEDKRVLAEFEAKPSVVRVR